MISGYSSPNQANTRAPGREGEQCLVEVEHLLQYTKQKGAIRHSPSCRTGTDSRYNGPGEDLVSISIREYSPSDADAVARMWNESGVGWPDGWSRVATSDEYWLDEIDQLDPLVIYLAVEDDRVVAYCELNEDSERADVAWLDLINVHPSAWSHGVGRDLVRRGVELATARGYRRMDLSTWLGNFRAVPLYKKCGFFWRPGTAVHMENYLPLLHTVPQCVAFFARHDWYKSMRRDLAVTQDDERGGNIRGYRYRWEAGDEVLEVFIDRLIDGIAALETNQFALRTSFDGEVLIAGQTARACWTLTNKGDHPLDVVLVARGHGLAGNVERRISLETVATVETVRAHRHECRFVDSPSSRR